MWICFHSLLLLLTLLDAVAVAAINLLLITYHINMLDAANGLLSATFCFSSVA